MSIYTHALKFCIKFISHIGYFQSNVKTRSFLLIFPKIFDTFPAIPSILTAFAYQMLRDVEVLWKGFQKIIFMVLKSKKSYYIHLLRAALEALDGETVSSTLAVNARATFKKVASGNKLNLVWILGQAGSKDNERANKLAK